jgi:hypothetical protein
MTGGVGQDVRVRQSRGSDSPPRAARLSTPRWRDGRLLLGVLLVLVAVVVGARVFAAADRETAVYVASHPLVPGEHLAPGDLVVGHVRFNAGGGRYVAATGAAPVGYVVTRYVGAQELVPIAALAASAPAVAASRFVTVPVEPGHVPSGLGHGDLVDVYLTPKAVAGSEVPAPRLVASGVPVDSADAGSRGFSTTATESVVLSVPAAEVRSIVHAVESGTIDLAMVPNAPSGPVSLPESPDPGTP